MRSTYKQLYYINRSKIKADGTTAIMCRVTTDGKAAVLATGLYCTPDEWNSKKGETFGFAHQFKHNLSYHSRRHSYLFFSLKTNDLHNLDLQQVTI